MPIKVFTKIERYNDVCVCVCSVTLISIFACVCFRLSKRNTTNCRRPFPSFHWRRVTFSNIPSLHLLVERSERCLNGQCAKSAHCTTQKQGGNQADKSDECDEACAKQGPRPETCGNAQSKDGRIKCGTFLNA